MNRQRGHRKVGHVLLHTEVVGVMGVSGQPVVIIIKSPKGGRDRHHEPQRRRHFVQEAEGMEMQSWPSQARPKKAASTPTS